MGLLGSLIKNAVGTGISDGINKGISEGINKAVSSAAERIVAPKVDAYANSVASSLDEASKSLDEATQVQKESERAGNGQTGTSSLEQSLSRWAQSMEKFAEAAEKNYEEKTPGLDKWNELLPGFPIWPYGGKNFEIEEKYRDDRTSTIFYEFRAEGATVEELDAYAQLLKKEGFTQKYKDSDSVLYKEAGGEYLGFGSVEAFNDLDVMCISLGRTKDLNEV